MKKCNYTWMLLLLAIVACENGDGDDYLVEDFINYEIVDSVTNINLVGLEGAPYHPDSIRFYDENMEVVGGGFIICSPDINSEYASQDFYVWIRGKDPNPPTEMPVKTFYLRLNQHDTDTLKLTYRYEVDSFGKGRYQIVTEFNGYEIRDRYEFGSIGCGVGLPKF